MDIVEQEIKPMSLTEINSRYQQDGATIYLASEMLKPGLTIWELDIMTGEVRKATIDMVSIEYLQKTRSNQYGIGTSEGKVVLALNPAHNPEPHKRMKIIRKKNHLYLPAINLKVAKKKFEKMIDLIIKRADLFVSNQTE